MGVICHWESVAYRMMTHTSWPDDGQHILAYPIHAPYMLFDGWGEAQADVIEAACFQPAGMEEALILGGIRCFFVPRFFGTCNLKENSSAA